MPRASVPGQENAAVLPPTVASRVPAIESAWCVTALYVAATLVLTWPLAAGLTRDLPGDLGDSLLNCWIIGWGADHMLRFLSGDLRAFTSYWNANIFYPTPLALGFSEHLTPLALQALPVYAATGNLVLCYNLLFLSAFVLSGLGMYLLVRDITRNPLAAFAAGLLFAFAPYRYAQIWHLQVMTSQWMPFALLGVRRWAVASQQRREASMKDPGAGAAGHRWWTTGSWPLAWGAVALVAQSLSCGYFLFYFGPFAVAFAVREVLRRRLYADARALAQLAAAGVLVVALTLPFLLPYRELRALDFPPRPVGEVQALSADLLGYLTTIDFLHGWGKVFNVRPWAENALFPGATMTLLAVFAVAAGAARRRERSSEGAGATDDSEPALFWVCAAVAAVVLSFGPVVQVEGRPLFQGPYALFYRFLPGLDGLRVPARLAMVVTLMLSVLAGIGLGHLLRRTRKPALAALVVIVALVTEVQSVPLPVNGAYEAPGLRPTPRFVLPGQTAPRVYRQLRALPDDAVVIEFPFGEPAYERQYVFYSAVHWKRLVNGFSGAVPSRYYALRESLGHGFTDWDRAWEALSSCGASFVVVHEGAYLDGEGARVSEWLVQHGARLRAGFVADKLFELPRR